MRFPLFFLFVFLLLPIGLGQEIVPLPFDPGAEEVKVPHQYRGDPDFVEFYNQNPLLQLQAIGLLQSVAPLDNQNCPFVPTDSSIVRCREGEQTTTNPITGIRSCKRNICAAPERNLKLVSRIVDASGNYLNSAQQELHLLAGTCQTLPVHADFIHKWLFYECTPRKLPACTNNEIYAGVGCNEQGERNYVDDTGHACIPGQEMLKQRNCGGSIVQKICSTLIDETKPGCKLEKPEPTPPPVRFVEDSYVCTADSFKALKDQFAGKRATLLGLPGVSESLEFRQCDGNSVRISTCRSGSGWNIRKTDCSNSVVFRELVCKADSEGYNAKCQKPEVTKDECNEKTKGLACSIGGICNQDIDGKFKCLGEGSQEVREKAEIIPAIPLLYEELQFAGPEEYTSAVCTSRAQCGAVPDRELGCISLASLQEKKAISQSVVSSAIDKTAGAVEGYFIGGAITQGVSYFACTATGAVANFVIPGSGKATDRICKAIGSYFVPAGKAIGAVYGIRNGEILSNLFEKEDGPCKAGNIDEERCAKKFSICVAMTEMQKKEIAEKIEDTEGGLSEITSALKKAFDTASGFVAELVSGFTEKPVSKATGGVILMIILVFAFFFGGGRRR